MTKFQERIITIILVISAILMLILLGITILEFLNRKNKYEKQSSITVEYPAVLKSGIKLNLPEEIQAISTEDRLICDSVVNGTVYLSYDNNTFFITPESDSIRLSDFHRYKVHMFSYDDCLGDVIAAELD